MPFRRTESGRNHLDSQRRTGEPSPSIWHYHPDGYWKTHGPHTEKLRLALWEWMKEKLGSIFVPLTFEYRLSRHQTVTLTGRGPYIKHLPSWGKGLRGLVLELNILSIDGIPFKGYGKRSHLAWNRILGRDKLLLLPEPKQAQIRGGNETC